MQLRKWTGSWERTDQVLKNEFLLNGESLRCAQNPWLPMKVSKIANYLFIQLWEIMLKIDQQGQITTSLQAQGITKIFGIMLADKPFFCAKFLFLLLFKLPRQVLQIRPVAIIYLSSSNNWHSYSLLFVSLFSNRLQLSLPCDVKEKRRFFDGWKLRVV